MIGWYMGGRTGVGIPNRRPQGVNPYPQQLPSPLRHKHLSVYGTFCVLCCYLCDGSDELTRTRPSVTFDQSQLLAVTEG